MNLENMPHVIASQVAHMLGDVIIHHAPWSSEISEQTKRRITDDWLEKLEQHTTSVIGPLIDQITSSIDAPPEIADLLTKVRDPSAQFGSFGQQFFVFGVMFSLATTLVQPFLQQVTNDSWQANPDRPLTPAVLATAAVRGIDQGDNGGVDVAQWLYDTANENGMSNTDFDTLVGTAGQPPDATLLFEMIRRQVITEDQLVEALKQGDLRDQWISYVTQMRYVTPTPTDMVRAAVQNQVDPATAEQYAIMLGLEPAGYVQDNPDWWTILYNSAGRPPGPEELARAANRGIIPWSGTGADQTTFQQGISESDLKNKWEPILQQLAVYWPANGDVRSLQLHGGITAEQAAMYYQANGVPSELAQAYAYVTEHEQITQDKALAKGDILTAVQEQLMSDDEAIQLLSDIGYTGDNAQTLVSMAHFRWNLEAQRTAVRQIEQLYTKYKMTATDATNALSSLGIPSAQVTSLMTMLELQRSVEVPTLSAGAIATALYYAVIPQDVAMYLMEQLGYQPYDAWILLSNRLHAALPDQPPAPAEIGAIIGTATSAPQSGNTES